MEVLNDPPDGAEFSWVKNTVNEGNIGGEIASSKYIDGFHGEYDLTSGHLYCYDPYPDSDTAY